MIRRQANRAHAAKVAAVAALIVLVLYVAAVVVLNVVTVRRLTSEVDARLAGRLADAARLGAPAPAEAGHETGHESQDVDDAPAFVWEVAPSGAVTRLTADAPALPNRVWSRTPVTTSVAGSPFRFDATHSGPGWLVSGQSIADVYRARDALVLPEVLFGAVLFGAVFAGSLVVGLRASAPLEEVRRRQAEFTADASHELRTPLSVIEAEVDVALLRRRTQEEYEGALRRVAGEGRRLRSIVDDLLFLARADSVTATPGLQNMTDVAQVAAQCTDRFQALAQRRQVTLTSMCEATGPFIIEGVPEWIDRLVGVLIDNACKYAGRDGHVEVRVHAPGNRVELEVNDDGPGIPAGEHAAVFDRFHRATSEGTGAGLGLAIADSVVRATQGNWSVGRAALGGTKMAVSWHRVRSRQPPSDDDGFNTSERKGPRGRRRVSARIVVPTSGPDDSVTATNRGVLEASYL